jgi:hypothetical protein
MKSILGPEEEKRNSVSDWNTKRVRIFTIIDGTIKSLETTLGEIDKSRLSLDQADDSVREDYLRLRPMRDIYACNDICPKSWNPVFEGSIDMLIGLSEYEDKNAQGLASAATMIRTGTDEFLARVTASAGIGVMTMGTATAHLTEQMENKEAVLPQIEAIQKPSALDRRIELSSKLSAIDPSFPPKLDGSWQTLQDGSKTDRYRQAASSIRELVSDVLSVLAPDNEVRSTKWFRPERENEKPTLAQRARYAMLGENEALGEADLEPILELAEKIRESHKTLNSVVHYRKYERDLQAQTEILIDECQVLLLKLLQMRMSYFKA